MAHLVDLLTAYAWPLTSLLIVLLFRSHIIALLHRIKKAELPGGVTIDTFPEELRDAKTLSVQVQEEEDMKRKEREAKQCISGDAPRPRASIPLTEVNARMLNLGMAPSPSGLELSYYRVLAERDPNLALAGLRMEVELMLRNLTKGWKVETTPRDSASVVVKRLRDRSAITSRQAELTTTVLRLCNSAVHGLKVTETDVDELLGIAAVLRDQYVTWLSWGFSDGWRPKEKLEEQTTA